MRVRSRSSCDGRSCGFFSRLVLAGLAAGALGHFVVLGLGGAPFLAQTEVGRQLLHRRVGVFELLEVVVEIAPGDDMSEVFLIRQLNEPRRFYRFDARDQLLGKFQCEGDCFWHKTVTVDWVGWVDWCLAREPARLS